MAIESDPIGQQLTFYPPHNSHGQLNLVSGYRAIAARILTLLLTRPGEDPIHPDMGYAPDLFDNLSQYSSQYYVTTIEQVILAWNTAGGIGLNRLTVEVDPQNVYTNEINISILFGISGYPSVNTLRFGLSQYVGADYTSIPTFVNEITLNGAPFTGFTNG